MSKDDIRPFYGEFIGFLSQIPELKRNDEGFDDKAVWEQYNASVELLSKVSDKDYSSFKIEPLESGTFGSFIRLLTYRQKLGGLIARLHQEYFRDEPAPFSGVPSVVVNQTQEQNQSVTILLEVQSKIDEQLPQYEDGSKEHSFLKKLKSSLPTISNVTQLISTIGKVANDFGIGPEAIANMFS